MKRALLVLLAACGSHPAQPVDAGMAGIDAHGAAELRACEAQVATQWPTTGLAPPVARASYEQVIGDLMKKYDVPGGTVALAKDGRLLLALGLGYEDRPNLQPAHVDQLFRLASLSKQLTSAGVVKLVAAGKVKLDDPALSYLTDLTPLPGKSIDPTFAQATIRNLLEHTGGWNRDSEAWGDPMFRSVGIANDFGVPPPADASLVVRWMLDKTPTYAPGTTYCYSNFGYDVLGRVIEHVTGQPYETWMQANVLAPAGIHDMKIGRTRLELRDAEEAFYDDDPANGVAPSSVFPDVTGPVPWPYGGWYLEAMDSHGGWIASALDLLRFEHSIDPSAFSANPGVATCNTDGTTNPASTAYWYGFGWQVNQYGNLWHTGALSGTATEDVITADGYTWVALFDRRPATGDFYGELDQDLWTALSGATDLPSTGDLWGDFPDYGPWGATLDVPSGMLATRIEGRLSSSGTPEYRARVTSLAGDSAAGLDCLDYQARSAGKTTVSLQWFTDTAGDRRYQASWTN